MEEVNRQDNEYQVNIPYPEPQVEEKNRQYARLLLSDYAGRKSELTSLLQYAYNAYVLQADEPEIAEIMNKISEVDRKHMDLLGETIFQLGVRPRYGSARRYWTGNNVAYRRTLKEILEEGIELETAMINKYRDHRRQIRDRYIDALLQRLILDERLHRRTFRQLYRRNIGPLPNNQSDRDDLEDQEE